MLNKLVLPDLGHFQASVIAHEQVAAVVNKVRMRGLTTGDKTLALIRAVFRWAIGRGSAQQ